MRGCARAGLIFVYLVAACRGDTGAQGDLDAVEPGDLPDATGADQGEVGAEVPHRMPVPLREMLGGVVLQKVRFVLDASLQGVIHEDDLKQKVLAHSLREADPYGTLTAAQNWWEDYQDQAEILYYSAEHVFSD